MKKHHKRTHSKKVEHHTVHHHAEDNEVTYVAIDQPIDFRRMLLTSAISTTYSLKDFQGYNEIKKRKMEKMEELRDKLKAIEREMNKLRNYVPKEKDIKYLLEPIQVEVQEVHKDKKKVEHKDKITMEIEELKRRLDSMNQM